MPSLYRSSYEHPDCLRLHRILGRGGGKSLGDVKTFLITRNFLSDGYPNVKALQHVAMPVIRHRYTGKLTGLLDKEYVETVCASAVEGNFSLPLGTWEELVAQCVVEEL